MGRGQQAAEQVQGARRLLCGADGGELSYQSWRVGAWGEGCGGDSTPVGYGAVALQGEARVLGS
jgi:hypothetical protein